MDDWQWEAAWNLKKMLRKVDFKKTRGGDQDNSPLSAAVVCIFSPVVLYPSLVLIHSFTQQVICWASIMGQAPCQVLGIQKWAEVRMTSPQQSLESVGRCGHGANNHTYWCVTATVASVRTEWHSKQWQPIVDKFDPIKEVREGLLEKVTMDIILERWGGE